MKMMINGVLDQIKKLEKLGANADKVTEQALYDGAGVLADLCRTQVETLPVSEKWGTPQYPKKGIRKVEKEGLIDSLGISPMRKDNGVTNVLIGFDGYNEMGKANQMIANATNSGTTFSVKIPFMDTAKRSGRKAAEKKMKDTLEKEIEKYTK